MHAAFFQGTFKVLPLVAALFLFLPTVSRAAVVPLTLEQMVAVADEVIAVRAESSTSTIAAGRITTTTRFTVLETYKGATKDATEITSLGGTWRTLVMDVPNVPAFRPGEESVLFLSRPVDRLPEPVRERMDMDSPLVQSMQVIGGHQGKFLVVSHEGLPNSQERKSNDAIPFDARVVRQAGATFGDPSKSPTWSEFRASIIMLVNAQEQKAAEKSAPTTIYGINGEFHVPDRLADKTIRFFDPLPSMAFATDEELKALQEAVEEAVKARQAAEAAGGEDEDQ